jgi:hypothetical protein
MKCPDDCGVTREVPAAGGIDHLNVERASPIAEEIVALGDAGSNLVVEARRPDSHEQRHGGRGGTSGHASLCAAGHPDVERDAVETSDRDRVTVSRPRCLVIQAAIAPGVVPTPLTRLRQSKASGATLVSRPMKLPAIESPGGFAPGGCRR